MHDDLKNYSFTDLSKILCLHLPAFSVPYIFRPQIVPVGKKALFSRPLFTSKLYIFYNRACLKKRKLDTLEVVVSIVVTMLQV